eukprot:jgi/Hompol1/1291/HPOL_003531-RA
MADLVFQRTLRGRQLLPLPSSVVGPFDKVLNLTPRQHTLLQLFFSSPVFPEFPLEMDFEGFMQSDFVRSPFLIFAMCAISAKYIQSTDPQGENASMVNAGDDQFAACVKVMGIAVEKSPTYSTILGLVFLATYCAGSGRLSLLWTVASMATRLVTMLGIDNELRHPDAMKWSPVERELRRRLFWMVYELDAHSAMSGRIHILTRAEAVRQIPLPSSETISQLPSQQTVIPPALSNLLPSTLPALSGLLSTPSGASNAASATTTPTPLSPPFSDLLAGLASAPSSTVSTHFVSPTSVSLISSGPTAVPTSLRAHYLTLLIITMRLNDLLIDEENMQFESTSFEAIQDRSVRRQQILDELTAFQTRLPFSLCSAQPEHILQQMSHSGSVRNVTSIILMFHHVRIALYSSQFYRLYEHNLYNVLTTDPNFSAAVESSFVIYELMRGINRLPQCTALGSPTFARCIISALRTFAMAHRIGFLGIDKDMLNEMARTFEETAKVVKKYWIWGKMVYDTLRAEHFGPVQVSSATRQMSHSGSVRNVTSIILMFHHVRIALYSSQFYRLYEHNLYNVLTTDPNFSAAVESSFVIYELMRGINRLPQCTALGSPTFARCIISALRTFAMAHRIGFLGIDKDMLNEMARTFEETAKVVKKYWIWGKMVYDTLRAEHFGPVQVSSATRE